MQVRRQRWCWAEPRSASDSVVFLLPVRDLVDEAKDFHLMPERRPHLPAFKTRPRCCTSITGLVYAVGGLNSSGLLLLLLLPVLVLVLVLVPVLTG